MSAILNRPGRVLSVREREHIRNRLRASEAALQGQIVVPTNKQIGPEGMSARREGRFRGFMRDDVREDEGLLRAKIARDKRLLAQGDPGSLSKRERVTLEKDMAAQREWLRRHMCPKKLFYVKSSSPNFERATKACLREHTEEYKRRAAQYKQAMRQLDPDNPAASNLENIRP